MCLVSLVALFLITAFLVTYQNTPFPMFDPKWRVLYGVGALLTLSTLAWLRICKYPTYETVEHVIEQLKKGNQRGLEYFLEKFPADSRNAHDETLLYCVIDLWKKTDDDFFIGKCIQAILEAGGNLGAQVRSQTTPMHLVAEKRDADLDGIIKLHGKVDDRVLNIQNQLGQTPLMIRKGDWKGGILSPRKPQASLEMKLRMKPE